MQGWGMTWEEALERSRLRPVMFIGKPEIAHLEAVLDAIYCASDLKVFQDYDKTIFILSPNQYIVQSNSGALLSTVDSLIKWDDTPHIMDAFALGRRDLTSHEGALTEEQQYFYKTVGPAFIAMMRPLLLASYFATLIRTDYGYCFQSYADGVSTGKPSRVQTASPKGFLVASTLDNQWFTGLPFKPEDVSKISEIIGQSGNYTVEGTWCAVDNVVFDISHNLNNV